MSSEMKEEIPVDLFRNMIFSVGASIALAATFFLKDVPLRATQGDLEPERAEQTDVECDKELVHV